MRLPGLHSIHWKVFVFHLAVLILPLGYVAWKVGEASRRATCIRRRRG